MSCSGQQESRPSTLFRTYATTMSQSSACHGLRVRRRPQYLHKIAFVAMTIERVQTTMIDACKSRSIVKSGARWWSERRLQKRADRKSLTQARRKSKSLHCPGE